MRRLSLVGLIALTTLSLADETSKVDPSRLRALEQYALTQVGDPQSGKRLFQDEKRTRCSVCHRVADAGGAVGPDLSRIGGKFDRPHLIESLLYPSKQIVEGFRTSNLLTSSGQVVSGILKEQSDQWLVIEDVNAKRHRVPRAEVEEISSSEVSLMPDGLVGELSAEEFCNLVAYLESLRAGGNEKFGAGTHGPIHVPDGYRISTVATGFSGATALETLDDGRVLVCEQPGALRIVKDRQLLAEPMLELSVDSSWERGLIGVTVHPDFPRTPFVYVCYVSGDPYPHHRISRFRVHGDKADPASEQILLRGDNQNLLGGKVPAGHQGGALHFAPDGTLYVGIGEQTAETPAQQLDTFQGKILRIRDDGSIPKDNPFLNGPSETKASGKYRAIWAIGCRNPFTFAIDPHGNLLINDVGGKFEEINPGVSGGNYGWPTTEHGFTTKPGIVGPIHVYPQSSISGGDFAPENAAPRFAGRYFFADFVHGWIKVLDRSDPTNAETFASGLRRPVDLRFGRDGSLYVLLRNAWVIDDKFEGGTGSLLRIEAIQEQR